jgi:hypothetical protein
MDGDMYEFLHSFSPQLNANNLGSSEEHPKFSEKWAEIDRVTRLFPDT